MTYILNGIIIYYFTSFLNKSPDDRCVNPYLATILSHWVPLPDPGPPNTQNIGTLILLLP